MVNLWANKKECGDKEKDAGGIKENKSLKRELKNIEFFGQVEINQAFTHHTNDLHDDRLNQRNPVLNRVDGCEKVWNRPHQKKHGNTLNHKWAGNP